MASILYAWEFGANLGHIGPFLPLARELRQAATKCIGPSPSRHAVADFLAKRRLHLAGSPDHARATPRGPPLNYADILLRFGYADPRRPAGSGRRLAAN